MKRSSIRPDGPVVAMLATTLAVLGWVIAPAVGAFEVDHELALVLPAQNPFTVASQQSAPDAQRRSGLDGGGAEADDGDTPDGDDDGMDDVATHDDNDPVVI
jgi:hypothetical protein